MYLKQQRSRMRIIIEQFVCGYVWSFVVSDFAKKSSIASTSVKGVFLCCSRKSLKQPQRVTVFIASLSHQICISVFSVLSATVGRLVWSVMSVTPCPSSNRFTTRGRKRNDFFPADAFDTCGWLLFCSAQLGSARSSVPYRKNHPLSLSLWWFFALHLKVKES